MSSECKSRSRAPSGERPRQRRYPIYAAEVRRIGGMVTVHASPDRCEGTPVFRVGHISAGGDLVFLSTGLLIEDQANGAARVLAEFVGAREVKFAP